MSTEDPKLEQSLSAPDRNLKLTVGILILLYFALRLPWLFMVPMVGAPDEFSHFWVLKFMAEYLRLPEAAEVAAGGPSAVYGSLPQIGYLPHVFTARLLPLMPLPGLSGCDLSVTARFGSLLVGLPLLLCSIYMGRKLFPDRLSQKALPLMVVFHPQLILVHTYINNDSTAITLAAVVLVLLTRMLFLAPSLPLTFITGLTCGFLSLTKYSAYAVFPATLLGLLLAFHKAKTPPLKILLHLFVCAASALAVSLWWFLRTLKLYPGDLLGTKTMFRTWAVTYHRDLNFYMTPWQVMKEHRWWRSILFSFWGLFGYMDIYLWRWVYWTYFGYMLLALSTSLRAAFLCLKNWKNLQPSSQEQARAYTWAVLGATLVGNIMAMVYASTVNLGGGQGRYLFPSEIPIMSLLVAGLHLTGNWRKPLLLSLVIFNALVSIGCFIYLFPRYGFHFIRTY